MKQWLWEAFDAPVGWLFYAMSVAVCMVDIVWICDCDLQDIRPRMIAAATGLGVVCTARRFIVGHWR